MKHWGTIINEIVIHVERQKMDKLSKHGQKLLNEWTHGTDGI
jgi:hypothetical protein